jgi:hypothetical protein
VDKKLSNISDLRKDFFDIELYSNHQFPNKTTMGYSNFNSKVVEDVSMENPIDMPVVDFEAMINGSPEERTNQIDVLDKGFMTYGFVYLSNSSIPQEMVDEAFDWVSHNKRSKPGHLS